MSSGLLPQVFWFRMAFDCPEVGTIPRSSGRLLALPETCRLPDLRELEGQNGWVDVRAAWNTNGLGLAFEVREKVGPIHSGVESGSLSDSVQIWIDTRDTRNIHRASRFCQRFQIVVRAQDNSKSLDTTIAQKPIARATAEAPLAPLGSIQTRAERIMNGWRLEVFFPAASFHGFDPETNRRLGFFYEVNDPDRGTLSPGVGREFPIGEDPSLWTTLVLNDEASSSRDKS